MDAQVHQDVQATLVHQVVMVFFYHRPRLNHHAKNVHLDLLALLDLLDQRVSLVLKEMLEMLVLMDDPETLAQLDLMDHQGLQASLETKVPQENQDKC